MLAAVLALPAFGGAEERRVAPERHGDASPRREKKKLEEDIARELGGAPAAAQPPAAAGAKDAGGAQAGPAPQGTGGDAARTARLLLLPDMSAIGSGALAFGTYDIEDLSRPARSAPPTSRRSCSRSSSSGSRPWSIPTPAPTSFIAFTPDGADLEEAYLTTLRSPPACSSAPASSSAPSAGRTSSTRTSGSSWTRRSRSRGSSPTRRSPARAST